MYDLLIKVYLICVPLIGIGLAFSNIDSTLFMGFFAAAAVVPGFLFVLRRNINHGVLLWLVILLFSESTKLLRIEGIPVLSADRVLFAAIMAVYIVSALSSKDQIVYFDAVDKFMLGFLLSCLISMMLSGNIFRYENKGYVSGILANGFVVPFLIYFLVKNTVKDQRDLHSMFRVLTLIGVYLSVTAIFENFKVDDLIFPGYITEFDAENTEFVGRAKGPFGQPAVNGTVIGMLYWISLCFINVAVRRFRNLYVSFISILTFAGLYFTYTRASWLAFSLSVVVLSPRFFRNKRVLVLAGLILSLAAVFLLCNVDWNPITMIGRAGEDIQPVFDRLNLYQISMAMFAEKPLFGYGFETFRENSLRFVNQVDLLNFSGVILSAHDSFIAILVELGIFGFLIYVGIYFIIGRNSWVLYRKLARSQDTTPWILIAFWGAGINFVVNMLFIDIRYFCFLNSLWMLLAGMISAIERHNFPYDMANARSPK